MMRVEKWFGGEQIETNGGEERRKEARSDVRGLMALK
jgi:hypothetical protein